MITNERSRPSPCSSEGYIQMIIRENRKQCGVRLGKYHKNKAEEMNKMWITEEVDLEMGARIFLVEAHTIAI